MENFISCFNHDYAILTLYYGGTSGLFPSQAPDEINRKLLEDLPYIRFAYPEAYLPKDIPPIGISWIQEEFSKGSYSHFGPHQEKIFQKRVEIAGENVKFCLSTYQESNFLCWRHTLIDYPATLEGAVESGERVSRLIIFSKNENLK